MRLGDLDWLWRAIRTRRYRRRRPKLSEWSFIGPFVAPDGKNPLDEVYPVEKTLDKIELTKKYNDGKLAWTTKPKWKDGVVTKRAAGYG